MKFVRYTKRVVFPTKMPHTIFSWCIAGLLLASTSHAAKTGSEIAAHFARVLSPQTGIFLPNESDYTSETIQRWDSFSAPTYLVSVKPALDTDVQTIVSHIPFGIFPRYFSQGQQPATSCGT